MQNSYNCQNIPSLNVQPLRSMTKVVSFLELTSQFILSILISYNVKVKLRS